MLLKLYAITTAIAWCVDLVYDKAYSNKMQREGYKYVNQNKSFAEKLAGYMSRVFYNCFPVLNFLAAIIILSMGEKAIDWLIDKNVKKGEIYMPEDNPEKTPLTMESSIDKEKIKTGSIQRINHEEKNKDLPVKQSTNSERLEELLLEPNDSFSYESLSSDLGEQGPVLRKIYPSKKIDY